VDPPHGSFAGRLRHRLAGEEPCAACAAAPAGPNFRRPEPVKPKRKVPFVLSGPALTDGQARPIDIYDRRDVLVVEVRPPA
jgi:hypothetical protein